MKIEDLKIKKKENRKRTAATILWEDCDRPAQELHFETVEEFDRKYLKGNLKKLKQRVFT
jgi:hypothetical protein